MTTEERKRTHGEAREGELKKESHSSVPLDRMPLVCATDKSPLRLPARESTHQSFRRPGRTPPGTREQDSAEHAARCRGTQWRERRGTLRESCRTAQGPKDRWSGCEFRCTAIPQSAGLRRRREKLETTYHLQRRGNGAVGCVVSRHATENRVEIVWLAEQAIRKVLRHPLGFRVSELAQ